MLAGIHMQRHYQLDTATDRQWKLIAKSPAACKDLLSVCWPCRHSTGPAATPSCPWRNCTSQRMSYERIWVLPISNGLICMMLYHLLHCSVITGLRDVLAHWICKYSHIHLVPDMSSSTFLNQNLNRSINILRTKVSGSLMKWTNEKNANKSNWSNTIRKHNTVSYYVIK